MFYVFGNPKSKKELKERVAAGARLKVFRPGMGEEAMPGSKVAVGGPHYPRPHSWYAEVTLNSFGEIVKVK